MYPSLAQSLMKKLTNGYGVDEFKDNFDICGNSVAGRVSGFVLSLMPPSSVMVRKLQG